MHYIYKWLYYNNAIMHYNNIICYIPIKHHYASKYKLAVHCYNMHNAGILAGHPR